MEMFKGLVLYGLIILFAIVAGMAFVYGSIFVLIYLSQLIFGKEAHQARKPSVGGIQDANFLCSGCIRSCKGSEIRSLPVWNEEDFSIGYRCDNCWLHSCEHTRTVLADADSKVQQEFCEWLDIHIGETNIPGYDWKLEVAEFRIQSKKAFEKLVGLGGLPLSTRGGHALVSIFKKKNPPKRYEGLEIDLTGLEFLHFCHNEASEQSWTPRPLHYVGCDVLGLLFAREKGLTPLELVGDEDSEDGDLVYPGFASLYGSPDHTRGTIHELLELLSPQFPLELVDETARAYNTAHHGRIYDRGQTSPMDIPERDPNSRDVWDRLPDITLAWNILVDVIRESYVVPEKLAQIPCNWELEEWKNDNWRGRLKLSGKVAPIELSWRNRVE